MEDVTLIDIEDSLENSYGTGAGLEMAKIWYVLNCLGMDVSESIMCDIHLEQGQVSMI